jgi:nicotinate-nucleotide adenylyltransferase
VEKTLEQRVGLFGGTFDPVHKGHLAIARQAAEEAWLDEVLFIPTADPPHKSAPGASFWHRVAMLEIVLSGSEQADDRFTISLLEAELSFPSYTVDTLSELKKRLLNPKCYFIIGADSLLDLHRWYQYQKLLSLTNFIVISRPGISLIDMQHAIERLPGSFESDIYCQRWCRSDGAEILLLMNHLQEDISSTMIRSKMKTGRMPQDVDSLVWEYILQEGLYL